MTARDPVFDHAETIAEYLEGCSAVTLREVLEHVGLRAKAPHKNALRELLRDLNWHPKNARGHYWVPKPGRNKHRGRIEHREHLVATLKLMRKGGIWTRSILAKELGVGPMQAMYTLRLLVERGDVVQTGVGRGTVYFAKTQG